MDLITINNIPSIDPSEGENYEYWEREISILLKTGNIVPENTTFSSSSGSSGACFIATAAYGTPLADDLEPLRAFRDKYLLTSGVGATFVDGYYRISPPITDLIARYEFLQTPVCWGIIAFLHWRWILLVIVTGMVGNSLYRRRTLTLYP